MKSVDYKILDEMDAEYAKAAAEATSNDGKDVLTRIVAKSLPTYMRAATHEIERDVKPSDLMHACVGIAASIIAHAVMNCAEPDKRVSVILDASASVATKALLIVAAEKEVGAHIPLKEAGVA